MVSSTGTISACPWVKVKAGEQLIVTPGKFAAFGLWLIGYYGGSALRLIVYFNPRTPVENDAKQRSPGEQLLASREDLQKEFEKPVEVSNFELPRAKDE